MLNCRDWIELLNLISASNIRYLVVGGYAVMKYTEPRFTKRLDLWVSTEASNAHALYNVLKEYGAPLMLNLTTPGNGAKKQPLTT